ncbi:MAG TPA: right-handed parallel beta-helix repeat-containing protein [Microbacteriaceae bacterium]|nr:right-handed parallel beta-helix repeat-containing protein [Microbacteriaceae bacterium]
MKRARLRAAALSTMLLAVIAGLLVVAAPAHAAGDVWVDDDWIGQPNGTPVATPSGTKTIGTDAFATLTAGLATAPTTVHLAAGHYPEQVDITQSTTILGDGAGTTFIDRGPSPLATVNSTMPYVTVRGGATVAISGVTVQGSGPISDPSPPPYAVGVLIVGGADLTMTNSVVTGIMNHPLSGAQGGVGILVGSTVPPETGSLTLLDSVVSEYQKVGVVVRPNSSAHIERVEVIGHGWVCEIAMNGIQIQGPTTVIDSIIRDNRYEKVGGPGCGGDMASISVGISVSSPTGPVTIRGNTISGNEAGVYERQTASNPILIEDNDVTGLLGDPKAVLGSSGLYLGVDISGPGVVATGNRVSNADYGITVKGAQSITSNLVQDNGVGISLMDSPALFAANAILGNTTGVEGAFANPNANWYGCNAGPGTTGCDTIAAGYDEPDWLVFTMTLGACSVAEGEDLTVTAAITQTAGGTPTSGYFVPTLPITPISGAGVTPIAPTTTLIGGTAMLQFVGSVVGPGSLSATAQNQVVASPGAATGCGAAGVTVTMAELPPTGDRVGPQMLAVALLLGAMGSALLAITIRRPRTHKL